MGYAVGDTIISPGPLMTTTVITALGAGTFIKPTSPPARFHLVRCWGPGGAGGGVTGAGTGQGEGGGGGAGGYCEKWYLDSSLAANEAYFVGTGGTGVSAGNGNAGTAATTFKGLSAGAGGGGIVMTSSTGNSGAARGGGGTATGGDLNFNGGDGNHGRVLAGQPVLANHGGAAPGGGAAQFPNFGSGNGVTGKFPGGGGSGAYSTTTNQSGGAGANGMIQIVSVY